MTTYGNGGIAQLKKLATITSISVSPRMYQPIKGRIYKKFILIKICVQHEMQTG